MLLRKNTGMSASVKSYSKLQIASILCLISLKHFCWISNCVQTFEKFWKWHLSKKYWYELVHVDQCMSVALFRTEGQFGNFRLWHYPIFPFSKLFWGYKGLLKWLVADLIPINRIIHVVGISANACIYLQLVVWKIVFCFSARINCYQKFVEAN